MKKHMLILVLLLAGSTAVFSQAMDLNKVQTSANELMDKMAGALPLQASVGLNWSDAYIGQLLALPPHFGVGVAAGASFVLDTPEKPVVKDFFSSVGITPPTAGDNKTFLPIPAAVAEARLGGLGIPFDIGIKAGLIPEAQKALVSQALEGLGFNYLLVGADLRFSLLKQNVILPHISVGFGVSYSDSSLTKAIGTSQSYSYTAGSETYAINIDKPTFSLNWKSTVYEAKVQVSKSLLIFTPYVGASGYYANSEAGYALKADTKYLKNGVEDPVAKAELEAAMKTAGVTPPNMTVDGFGYTKQLSGFGCRVFGGTSINLFVVRLDLTGMWDATTNALAASVGLRVQL